MSIYRIAPQPAPERTEHVRVNLAMTLKRSYIRSVRSDGLIVCADGTEVVGDPARLVEAGLL